MFLVRVCYMQQHNFSLEAELTAMQLALEARAVVDHEVDGREEGDLVQEVTQLQSQLAEAEALLHAKQVPIAHTWPRTYWGPCWLRKAY